LQPQLLLPPRPEEPNLEKTQDLYFPKWLRPRGKKQKGDLS
jgi:hypothetical protein